MPLNKIPLTNQDPSILTPQEQKLYTRWTAALSLPTITTISHPQPPSSPFPSPTSSTNQDLDPFTLYRLATTALSIPCSSSILPSHPIQAARVLEAHLAAKHSALASLRATSEETIRVLRLRLQAARRLYVRRQLRAAKLGIDGGEESKEVRELERRLEGEEGRWRGLEGEIEGEIAGLERVLGEVGG